MVMSPIFEVVRIRQEIRETSDKFTTYQIASPYDAQELAASYIAYEDREVFLVDAQYEESGGRTTPGTHGKPECEHRPSKGSIEMRRTEQCGLHHREPSAPIRRPDPSREDIEVTKRLAEAGSTRD